VSSRLDNLQAAVLRVKLKRLDGWNERRREIAHQYCQQLTDLPGLRLPEEVPGCRAIYHQFTVRSPHRHGLRAYLENKGIGTAIHYPRPIHLQKSYSHLKLVEGSFPIAEKAAREVLSLPMHPELTDETLDDVALAVRAFFEDLHA
jgi:dTDP-4-amino-4,6-dideoxygalactose transaminase